MEPPSPFDFLAKRLGQSYGASPHYIPLSNANLTRGFTRQEYSNQFGGSIQTVYSSPQKGHKSRAGVDGIYFYTTPLNPAMPTVPGTDGLIFSELSEYHGRPRLMLLVVRLEANIWVPLGMYVFEKQNDMEPEEWMNLPKEVSQ